MKSKTNLTKRKIIGLLFIIIGSLVLTLMTYAFQPNYSEEHYEQLIDSFEVSQEKSNNLDDYEKNIADFEVINQEGSIIDPFITDKQAQSYNNYSAYALLYIPTLGELLPIYLGASSENLLNGIAVIEGTGLPKGGLHTRSVISGHRGYAGQTLFLNINYLSAGDLIHVIYTDSYLTYEVYNSEVITPSETHRLAPIAGEDILSLLTCTPIPTFHNRLVVNARRIHYQELHPAKQQLRVELNKNNIVNSSSDVITEDNNFDQLTEDSVSEKNDFQSIHTLIYDLQGNQSVNKTIETFMFSLRSVRLILFVLVIILVIRLLILVINSFQERNL